MRKLFIFINLIAIFLLSSCSEGLNIQYNPPIFALSTQIDVTFYNVDNYEEHYRAIKRIYNDVNRVASDFESNPTGNSVYDLNIKRELEASDLLVDMVNEAIELMDETKGYFNPFIGRLSHLWKESITETKIPVLDDVIDYELQIMNSTTLEIDGNHLKLVGEGNLDLGGLAKGYATKLSKDYLDNHGITRYLIDAGHSNIICGDKLGEDFKIGLTNPLDGTTVSVIKGQGLEIGTSSFEHQSFMYEGNRYHHIISPFTGKPINSYDSASVIMNDSARCDVYSTAIFLMDLEDIEKLREDIGIILIKDGKVIYDSYSGQSGTN